MMDRIEPDTPFTVTLDDLPHCGVSNRLERRIRLQFAGVLVVLAVVASVVVAILARAR